MMEAVKEYVSSKRMLYTLCFIALFAIDWTRGSQIGIVWAWTINMTGVVMAVILFSAYSPKEFLKPIYIIYSAIGIVALATAYYWWTMHQAAIFRGQLLTAVLNIWLLGIFVIKMFLEVGVYKTKKLHFCKAEIVAAVMLLWMLFSVNEDIWPGWYLVMFGLLYHTEYSKEDMETLKLGMLDGIIVSFFLLQGTAFIFRPYDVVRYRGIYANCNMNALFYGIVWVAFILRLYDIRKKKEKKWKEILCFLFASAMVAFSFMTGCRTALIAMIITGFFYAVFADFYCLKYKAGKFMGKLALYVVMICISIPIVYMTVRYLPPVFHHPVWYDGDYNINKVHSFDPWNSEKYISWEECSDMMVGRLETIIKMIFREKTAGLMTVKAADLQPEVKEIDSVDRAVQGRVDFWRFYMKNGNLRGHFNTEGHDLPDFPDYYVWHSQNTFVQFWYYYGIPSAILFALVVIMLVLLSIKKIGGGKDNALICQLYIVFCAAYGLTEAVWYPGQMILFLAFFTPKFLQEKESA